jgi:hypothetical protein
LKEFCDPASGRVLLDGVDLGLYPPFPAEYRPWMLDRYQQSVAPSGWRVPSTGDLNLMLETAELSRIANYLAWVCIAAREPQADWLLESLEEIERWFEALEPAIRPAPTTQAVAGP